MKHTVLKIEGEKLWISVDNEISWHLVEPKNNEVFDNRYDLKGILDMEELL